MTFVALVCDSSVNLSSDELVLGAKHVLALDSAVDVGRYLTQLLEQSGQEISEAKQRAFDEGHSAGKAAGLLAARDDMAAELTAMALDAHHQRIALQGSVARLAIQVVRKLAGEIGASEMVAGLAQTAASDLLPGASLTLWVHPSLVDVVRARLSATQSAHPDKSLHVEICADDTLDLFDCTLDTACGTIIAGLDAQLKCLETALTGELETARHTGAMDGENAKANVMESVQAVSG